jgi:hypothetical protein
MAARFGLTDAEHRAAAVHFARLRARHDPEFWFASAVKIKTKRQGTVPFILNVAQRGLLGELLTMYHAGAPVRVVLVKARQWGGSTLVQLFLAWIQQCQRREWNALVVAHVHKAATHIRGMYRTMARLYPAQLGTITLKPYEGQADVRHVPERDCIIGVGSAKSPDGARSFTYHMLHLSEVGLWKSTDEISAEDLAQALEGGLVQGEGTVCVLESTAKGVGNFFHRSYESAKKGESAYRTYFVGWWQISDYTRTVEAREFGAFVASWSAYERWLWSEGATVEGIAWYRHTLSSPPFNGDHWRMKEEFPTTAEEAFIATGRRVFEPEYVTRARATCKAPAIICDVRGEAMKGEDALKNLHLVQSDAGSLRIWRRPYDAYGGLLDLRRFRVTNRYGAFLDVGGRWHGADYFVLSVFDRAPLTWGAAAELAAEWRCHRDQDLAAWEAVQICTVYDRALLAIEKNSIKRRQGAPDAADSPHHQTILDEIAEVYHDRLFHTVDVESVNSEPVLKYGFSTNAYTKPLIINGLNAALRDGGYVERESGACDEMDYYEVKDDGSYGAREGQKDDRVMSRAGAVWLCTSYMEPPRLVALSSGPAPARPTGAAVF